jgi:hypothetical protein
MHSLDVKITGTVTGERVRRGLFGHLIMQVQVTIESRDADTDRLLSSTSIWRDATKSDLPHFSFPQEVIIYRMPVKNIRREANG